MSKNLFKNLTVWQNYVHYLLLTLGVFGIHKLTDIWGIEELVVTSFGYKLWLVWILLFMFYAVGIFIVDTIIHLLFAIAPKPIQWSD